MDVNGNKCKPFMGFLTITDKIKSHKILVPQYFLLEILEHLYCAFDNTKLKFTKSVEICEKMENPTR